ncbi:hypothetical protein VM1G_02813 [Cytospora mali]|uniref:Rhodopsin domain-containing protein n=1 Tax=Cytospora mali TaxID=578113 RepID=A0A194VTQ0_CYTMA|nr:hypothetical protein VM1G_02813 [Valsa mali]
MSYQSKKGLLAVCGSLLGLSGIAVGLRLHARKQQRAAFMTDDVLAISSLGAYTGAAIVVFIAIHYKTVGYATSDLTPAEAASTMEILSKLQIAWDILSTISLACIKLSALFFYRRIFCVGLRTQWFNIASFVTIMIVVIWLIVFQFLTGFQCGTHFSALWDGTYTEYCTISFPFLYVLAVSDFLLDIWILALPIPRIIQLQASIQRKVAIIGVFLLAFIGLGASITRMVNYIQIEDGGPLYFIYHDEEEAVTRAFFFTMLEIGISLVAVNLPSLWLLFTSISPEKVARSIRSVLSLASLRSGGSGGDNDMTKRPYGDRGLTV